jgi:hypothetical protein
MVKSSDPLLERVDQRHSGPGICLNTVEVDMKTISRRGHPDILCSLAFVRTGPELEKTSLISSLALFTVTRTGPGEAKFGMFHARFDAIQDRESIIADVCKLVPRDAKLLVRQPWPEYLSAWIDRPENGLPLLDNERLARALPGTTLLPVCCSDDQIIASGEAFGLDMPGPSSTPLKRHRRAPLIAIALWGIYLRRFASSKEVRQLSAAMQAWHLLEKVKPLPRR